MSSKVTAPTLKILQENSIDGVTLIVMCENSAQVLKDVVDNKVDVSKIVSIVRSKMKEEERRLKEEDEKKNRKKIYVLEVRDESDDDDNDNGSVSRRTCFTMSSEEEFMKVFGPKGYGSFPRLIEEGGSDFEAAINLSMLQDGKTYSISASETIAKKLQKVLDQTKDSMAAHQLREKDYEKTVGHQEFF